MSSSPLRPGQKAPNFSEQAVLPSLEFEDVSLSQYKGKWLVIFSYQEDFSFVSPTELVELNNKLSEFNALNASVVAVSCDSVYVHNAWRMTDTKQGGIGDINFPIIGDINKKLAREYGFYNEEDNKCYSGTVIINPSGVVMSVSYSMPDVGRSIDDAVEFVKACQAATGKFNVQLSATKTNEVNERNIENPDKIEGQTKCCLLV